MLPCYFVGVLEADATRLWNTRLHVKIRKKNEGVEGQAGSLERRKVVIGGRKLSGAGR